jgi:hypothetical protein
VPARRQLYRPGGTSYLALPALAANRLDPSDPQVPLADNDEATVLAGIAAVSGFIADPGQEPA